MPIINKKISVSKKNKKIIESIKESKSDEIKKIKIRVIGIGGGGSTIVSEIASRIPKASFVSANTDIQALKTINKKVNCFQFGQKLTYGLGTGMKVDLGRSAAQNEKERIKKLCEGYDLCIIVACLGGGTGSGAVPVFAKMSKSLGNLTYGIFTLPFKFEGEKKMEIAKESLNKTKNYLDAITIIPNEKVFQIINKDTPLKQAFSLINKNLIKSLEGLIETIYEPGLINIDFADFKTIFHGKGKLTYLNTAEVFKKEDLNKDLINQIFTFPLYPYTIQGAKGVLFNIFGEKNLSLSEVNQISKNILELVNPEAKIIFGVSHNKKSSESIMKITLLAVGCEKPKEQDKNQNIKSKIKNKNQNNQNQSIEKKIKMKTKIKIKTNKNSTQIKNQNKKILSITNLPTEQLVDKINIKINTNNINQDRTRKNGLQIKKETQELEKEMLEKEKLWDIPAFLRRKI